MVLKHLEPGDDVLEGALSGRHIPAAAGEQTEPVVEAITDGR